MYLSSNFGWDPTLTPSNAFGLYYRIAKRNCLQGYCKISAINSKLY